MDVGNAVQTCRYAHRKSPFKFISGTELPKPLSNLIYDAGKATSRLLKRSVRRKAFSVIKFVLPLIYRPLLLRREKHFREESGNFVFDFEEKLTENSCVYILARFKKGKVKGKIGE